MQIGFDTCLHASRRYVVTLAFVLLPILLASYRVALSPRLSHEAGIDYKGVKTYRMALTNKSS